MSRAITSPRTSADCAMISEPSHHTGPSTRPSSVRSSDARSSPLIESDFSKVVIVRSLVYDRYDSYDGYDLSYYAPVPRELTFRSLLLGAAITTVFTAANVYLGLKVGITFASSIPAAVISMALLSLVRDSSILENNIVQTVASAACTLSAIIFVLPGLVIVGWWTGFPFWQSFLIC